jgi:hypothetical protein
MPPPMIAIAERSPPMAIVRVLWLRWEEDAVAVFCIVSGGMLLFFVYKYIWEKGRSTK